MNFCVRRIGSGFNAKQSRESILSFAAFVAAMAFFVVASGCGSSRPIKYYQISPPPAASPSGEAINVGIIVRLPLTSHIYREDPIVYANDAYQLGTYDTHRWAEPPAEMLQGAMVRGLRASGRFRAVQSQRSSSTGEYLLVTQLYAFNEITGANMAARLSYDVDLRELKTGNVVWSHSYNHDEPSTARDVPSLVVAMDKNVQRSVQEIEAGLDDYFKNHPVK